MTVLMVIAFVVVITPLGFVLYTVISKGISAISWRFLTGDLEQVKTAVVTGFKMPIDPGMVTPGANGEEPTLFDITHGTRFVLVDQKARIRGFYDADEAGMDDLVRDLTLVVSLEGPRS